VKGRVFRIRRQDTTRSGPPEARPAWDEAADALWLATMQYAASSAADITAEDAATGDPAAETAPPGSDPSAAPRPTEAHAPARDRRRAPAHDPRTEQQPAEDRRKERMADSTHFLSTRFASLLRVHSDTTGLPSDLLSEIPPLIDRRGVARALRPFKRQVESRLGDLELDDEATAERAAQDGLWVLECRPAQERWLDLDIVIDDSRFFRLHRPMCDQLIDSIGTVGAFRAVRLHLMDTDVESSAALTLHGRDSAAPRRPASALTSTGGNGRRLILVITDGVGEAWHSAATQRLLAEWGHSCPVAIINLLPRRQWNRTGIRTRGAWLSAFDSAIANRHYQARFPAPGAGDGDLTKVLDDELCVPMVEADPGQLSSWADFVAANRSRWYGAVAVCGPRMPDERIEETRQDIERTTVPIDLVRRFRATVSPTTFSLAVLLAAAPLNIHVIRLIQIAMLPQSRPADLSELIGSGLLRRVGGGGRRGKTEQVDEVTYDFVDGVRSELLAAGRRSDTARVLTTLGTYLGDRVRLLRELVTTVRAPHESPAPTLTEDNAAFAEPAVHALRAMSGPYRRPAQTLQHALEGLGRAPSKPSDGKTGSKQVDQGTKNLMNMHTETRDIDRDRSYKTVPPGVSVTIRNIPLAPERPASEPPPIWGNIPARNISFTGREEILEDLHRRLSVGTTAVLPEALHGMGGVGKSQIAIEYVHRHTNDYDLIWWIPAERTGQIQQAYVELASQLDLRISQEVNIAVPAVREALRLGRPFQNWLLVFDNAELVDEVRGFFPTNGPGKILVTSRNHAWTSVASSLEVDVFKREESKALLNLRGPGLSDENANELADVLGDLPLAIEQAAVWLAESGMPVEEYLNLFRKSHEKATELLGDVAPAAYELPVAAAWNVSLDRLRESDLGALQLLQVCAFFAPEPISRRLLSGARNVDGPQELLDVLGDPVKLGRAMRAINQYALAKISHRTGTITLHRLVQRVLVGQMSPEEVAVFRHCGHQLLTKADPAGPEDRKQWDEYAELLPHVLSSGIVDCDDQWARQLVLNQISFLFQWGDHQSFLSLAQQAVDTWTVKLGEDHDQTLSAGLLLGRALRLLGRFQEAYDHHLHVRDLLAAQRGMEDERTLEAQSMLGADLRYLGRFREALELDQNAFEIVQRRFGPNDPLTLDQAHLYAIDLRLTGDPAAASDLDHQTAQRKAVELGEDHLSTLGTQTAAALDEMERGRYREARDVIAQLHQTYEMRYGPDHPDTVECANVLSVAERKSGAHEQALKLSERAVAAYRGRYGIEHPLTVAAALNHAVNLRQNGDLDGAISLATDLGQNYERLFGPDHPNTASARINLAVALRLGGRVAEAMEMNEAALVKLTEQLGVEHPRSLVCAINLASDHFALGNAERALELDTATMARIQNTIGADHPTGLACSLNYSLDMRATGNEAEAKVRFADTLARYRRVLGDDHPGTIAAGKSVRADCDIYPIPV
jgi:tetratricopeptide (TPR) repeat protein